MEKGVAMPKPSQEGLGVLPRASANMWRCPEASGANREAHKQNELSRPHVAVTTPIRMKRLPRLVGI